MSVLKVKRLNEKARLPERATAGSAGYDLRACIEQPVVIEPGQVRKIPGLPLNLRMSTTSRLSLRAAQWGSSTGFAQPTRSG